MKRIAIVEDDTILREELAETLESAGYSAIPLLAFENAAAQLMALQPDLVLLDLNLPHRSGFEICRELKQTTAIPILVLSSRDHLRVELRALELGADEYLTKPCRKERLLARISNVLKRYEGQKNLLEGNGYLLDRNTFTLYFEGESVVLPPNQGKLLETLMTSDCHVAEKEALSMALWGTTQYIDDNALQVNIARLKKTMRTLGMDDRILAVRGIGYALVRSNEDFDRDED